MECFHFQGSFAFPNPLCTFFPSILTDTSTSVFDLLVAFSLFLSYRSFVLSYLSLNQWRHTAPCMRCSLPAYQWSLEEECPGPLRSGRSSPGAPKLPVPSPYSPTSHPPCHAYPCMTNVPITAARLCFAGGWFPHPSVQEWSTASWLKDGIQVDCTRWGCNLSAVSQSPSALQSL